MNNVIAHNFFNFYDMSYILMVAENFCKKLEVIDYPYFKPLVKQENRH